ncbi:MAG: sigma-70 family RNA polymerase sigma factor [Candidatus Bathyarchaeia archaeon]
MVAGDEEKNSEVMRTVKSSDPSPSTEVEQQETGKHIRDALRRLEPEYRDVLIMREYEGLSYEEISIVLDIPVGTVKSRIFRGKLELKRLLAPLLGVTVESATEASISSMSEGKGREIIKRG